MSERVEEKLADYLAIKGNINALTDLSKNEIFAITRLKGIANLYGISFIHELIDNFVLLKISLNRKGRKELLQIGKKRNIVQNVIQRMKQKIEELGGESEKQDFEYET